MSKEKSKFTEYLNHKYYIYLDRLENKKAKPGNMVKDKTYFLECICNNENHTECMTLQLADFCDELWGRGHSVPNHFAKDLVDKHGFIDFGYYIQHHNCI